MRRGHLRGDPANEEDEGWYSEGGEMCRREKKFEGMDVEANDEDEDMFKEMAGGQSGSVVFRRQTS